MKPSDTSKPHLIIPVGIPGSGKSFFAEHFAETFQAPIISFEKIHEQIYQHSEYTKEEIEITNNIAILFLKEVLKTGRTVIYEGQTSLRSERINITKIAHDAGYEPLIVWVQTDADTSKRRATKSTPQKSGITAQEFETRLKKFTSPHNTEKYIVISGKHTYVSQLKIVLKNLVVPRTRGSDTKSTRPSTRAALIR